MTSEPKLVLGLASGTQLVVERVMLFPELAIQEIAGMRAMAQEEMGGFSAGLSFWGSPGWAIGGAAILGIAESLVSNSKMKKGLAILKEVALKMEQLKSNYALVAIADIRGIHLAQPGEWRATDTRHVEIETRQPGATEYVGRFLRAAIKNTDIEPFREVESVGHHYVHDDSEFVNCEVNGALVAVRWSLVERYQFTPARTATGQAISARHEDTPSLLPSEESSVFGQRGLRRD
jgi:hypothetical protein